MSEAGGRSSCRAGRLRRATELGPSYVRCKGAQKVLQQLRHKLRLLSALLRGPQSYRRTDASERRAPKQLSNDLNMRGSPHLGLYILSRCINRAELFCNAINAPPTPTRFTSRRLSPSSEAERLWPDCSSNLYTVSEVMMVRRPLENTSPVSKAEAAPFPPRTIVLPVRFTPTHLTAAGATRLSEMIPPASSRSPSPFRKMGEAREACSSVDNRGGGETAAGTTAAWMVTIRHD
jgi:hypothetical protein